MAKKRIIRIDFEIEWDGQYESMSSKDIIQELIDYIGVPEYDVRIVESSEITPKDLIIE